MSLRTCLLCLIPLAALAQRPPQIVVRSPEVHADKRITFRLQAPTATEVALRAEFLSGQPPAAMTKEDNGVWSVTVGPVRPDLYWYSFSVNGVAVVDPRNPLLKPGARGGTVSLVDVAGEGADFHAWKDVPHGTVHAHWYQSKSLGKARRIHVYTPPGYEKDSKTRFPVFYLLHGSGDTDAEWSSVGRANHIIDNLLAANKSRPMIVVMPDGHAADPNSTDPAARGQNTALFEKDLLGDIIPLVEASYRVAPGSQNRALAGLSMGGGQTISIGLTHPDKFGWLGAFSAGGGLGAGGAEEFEKRYAAVLSSPAKFHKQVQLFWIACGRQDGLIKGSQMLSETLKKHGIRTTLRETEGGHVWWLWRQYLAEFAPLLFQKAS